MFSNTILFHQLPHAYIQYYLDLVWTYFFLYTKHVHVHEYSYICGYIHTSNVIEINSFSMRKRTKHAVAEYNIVYWIYVPTIKQVKTHISTYYQIHLHKYFTIHNTLICFVLVIILFFFFVNTKMSRLFQSICVDFIRNKLRDLINSIARKSILIFFFLKYQIKIHTNKLI